MVFGNFGGAFRRFTRDLRRTFVPKEVERLVPKEASSLLFGLVGLGANLLTREDRKELDTEDDSSFDEYLKEQAEINRKELRENRRVAAEQAQLARANMLRISRNTQANRAQSIYRNNRYLRNLASTRTIFGSGNRGNRYG